MPARKALPDTDHVMRFASQSKRFVDPDTEEFSGPTPAAFAIRSVDEGGLSVTWVEHFGEFSAATRGVAAAAHRESLNDKRLPKNAIFAWANVASVKAAGVAYSKGLRVVHAPVAGNDGHAEIRHFSDEDLDLLDHLSSSVFVEYEVVKDMDIPAP